MVTYIEITDKKALLDSVEQFCQKNQLDWIVDDRCVGELLSELETAAESYAGGFEDAYVDCDNRSTSLRLSDLRGVSPQMLVV